MEFVTCMNTSTSTQLREMDVTQLMPLIHGRTRAVLIGPPGAGKGTQAGLLSEALDVPHVSTGTIIRDAITLKANDVSGLQAQVSQGHLVPDNFVNKIVEEFLCKSEAQKGFILDGFPRNLCQAQHLEKLLSRKSLVLSYCIAISVDNLEIVRRLSQRSRKEKRNDDSNGTVLKRLDQFYSITAPLLEYYRRKNILIEISGVGPIKEISARIQAAINDLRLRRGDARRISGPVDLNGGSSLQS